MPGVDPSLLHRLASAHAVAGEHDAWRRPIAAASPSLRCWPGPFYVTSRRCRLPGDPPYRPTSVATDDQGISTCSRRWPHVCPPPPRRLAPRCLPGTTPCTTPNPRRSRRPGTAGSCCPRILPVDVAAAVVALHVLVRSPLTSRSGVPKLTVIPSGATQHRTPPPFRSRRPDAACSCCPRIPPVDVAAAVVALHVLVRSPPRTTRTILSNILLLCLFAEPGFSPPGFVLRLHR